MMVRTAPDGSDASAPRVAVVPRSRWETGAFWADNGIAGGMLESLRTLFDKAGNTADNHFMLIVDTNQPGSETWPRDILDNSFMYDAATMDRWCVPLAQTFASGRAFQ